MQQILNIELELGIAEKKINHLLASSLLYYRELKTLIPKTPGLPISVSIPFTDRYPEPIVLETMVDLTQVKGIPVLFFEGDMDALIFIDGKPYYGIDRRDRKVPLPAGKKLTLEIIIHPRKVLGEKYRYPEISELYLAVFDPVIYRFARKAKWLLDLAFVLRSREEDLATDITNSLLKILIMIDMPQLTPYQVLWAGKNKLLTQYNELVDEVLWIAENTPEKLVEAGYTGPDYELLRRQVLEADNILEETLTKLRRKYGKRGRIYAVGHAHIDAAWLWSYGDTVWKILKTIVRAYTTLSTMKHGVFVLSSPQYIEWLKEYRPDVYQMLRELVERNEIILVGGMWVESDTILSPRESLARQLLIGQHYLHKEFGKIARIGWLPDSFGYNPVLPQLLVKSGIGLFIIHKIEWNKYNKPIHHTFNWIGIDGAKIPTHVLVKTYSHKSTPDSLLEVWDEYIDKDKTPGLIYPYGYGDGGGGINPELIEKLDFYNKTPATPEIVHGGLDDFHYEILAKQNELPEWKGELYLEIHRGTYTTNHEIKKLVYMMDYMLRILEQLLTLEAINGGGISKEKKILLDLWKSQLRALFHDVLPGSSTNGVYEDVSKELKEGIDKAEELIHNVLGKIAGKAFLVAYNPTQYKRRELVRIMVPKGYIPDCIKDPEILVDENGKWLVNGYMEIDGFTVLKCNLVEYSPMMDKYGGVTVSRDENGFVLENKYIRIVVDDNGWITSIYDKARGIELIKYPSNIITVHDDIPHEWDAWDIDEETLMKFVALDEPEEISIVEEGTKKKGVYIRYRYGKSVIEETISITGNTNHIEVSYRFDWRDRRKLVKTWFYPNTYPPRALYGIGYGYIERPTTRNTSYEEAMFEVYFNGWFCLRDHDKGLLFVTPTRHGVSIKNNMVGISLLKTPILPNPLSDSGITEFSIKIIPFSDEGLHEILVEAEKILTPVYLSTLNDVTESTGEATKSNKLLSVKGDCTVSAIKPCEEDNCIVVRLFEPAGKTCKASLVFPKHIIEAYETDLLEGLLYAEKADYSDYEIHLELRPFEIKTFTLKFSHQK